MNRKYVYVRVSRIRRRWLRRLAIVATYPFLTVFGVLALLFKIVWTVGLSLVMIAIALPVELISMQVRLTKSSIRVWRLPGGDVQHIADPACAGGVHELERQQYTRCPKCGILEGESCKG